MGDRIMVRGLSVRFRLLIAVGATVLMGALSHAPAKAADLGGDCCADLEEPVAELEATTVRKGNKKISVELYGDVNKNGLWCTVADEQQWPAKIGLSFDCHNPVIAREIERYG